MEKKEVIIILVIVGIFLLLNKPYTGYQSFQRDVAQAQGSGQRIFTNPVETGDRGQPRMIVPNPTDPGFGYYDNDWSKRCSNKEDCPNGFDCEKRDQYSGYCTPKYNPY